MLDPVAEEVARVAVVAAVARSGMMEMMKREEPRRVAVLGAAGSVVSGRITVKVVVVVLHRVIAIAASSGVIVTQEKPHLVVRHCRHRLQVAVPRRVDGHVPAMVPLAQLHQAIPANLV